ERIAAQHAKDFRKGRPEPSGIAVIGNTATVARAVVRQIRGIGQHKINAAAAELPQDFYAIALNECIHLWLAEDLLALFLNHLSSPSCRNLVPSPGAEEQIRHGGNTLRRRCWLGMERMATRVTRVAFAIGARGC